MQPRFAPPPPVPASATMVAPDQAAPVPLGLGALVRGSGRRCLPSRGCMSQALALLVFDFGRGGGAALCETNRQLAQVANRWPDLPVLAQAETATALAGAGRLVIDVEADARALFQLDPTAYLDTSHVAVAAAALMGDAGWETVGVIAHPSHASRCIATVEAAGLRAVAPAITSDDADFDPASTQWWTRRRGSWVGREMAVVAHHLVTGRVRAQR